MRWWMWLWVPTAGLAGDLPVADRLLPNAVGRWDLVLTPPSESASPPLGSFVGQKGPTTCSLLMENEAKPLPRELATSQVWVIPPTSDGGIGFSRAVFRDAPSAMAVAGLDVVRTATARVDWEGLEAAEACCANSPALCGSEYVSRVWQGTGSVYRLKATEDAVKRAARRAVGGGPRQFMDVEAWEPAASWTTDSYFAYETAAFPVTTCAAFMARPIQKKGFDRFVGVATAASPEEAKAAALAEATRAVARSVGGVEDPASTERAETIVRSGDVVTCIDEKSAEGRYTGRARVFVETALATHATGEAAVLGEPTRTKSVPPSYPQRAFGLDLGEERCVARILVSALGEPSEIHVAECHALYAAEASRALEQWRWDPARGPHGQPVPAMVRVGITFAKPGYRPPKPPPGETR
jgi:hypothetical protein